MTHNDIYTKFMIEYDKANVTSSYPALTEYEIATLLDKAYLMLIARKVTGNNTRRVPFEYDVKAIEDLRPLVTSKVVYVTKGISYSDNECIYKLPEDLLYYLEGLVEYTKPLNSADKREHRSELVNLVDHKTAQKFRSTNTNIPWIKLPVSFLQDDAVHVLIDSYKHKETPDFLVTYIKCPAKFAASSETENTYLSNNFIYYDLDEYVKKEEVYGDDGSGAAPGVTIPSEDEDEPQEDTTIKNWAVLWLSYKNYTYSDTNQSEFTVYSVSGTDIASCNILILTGSNYVNISKKLDNTYTLTVLPTAISELSVEIKAICSEDSSRWSTRTLFVKYYKEEEPDSSEQESTSNEVYNKTATFNFYNPKTLIPSITPNTATGELRVLDIIFTNNDISISFDRVAQDSGIAAIYTFIHPYQDVDPEYYLRMNSGCILKINSINPDYKVYINRIEFYEDGVQGSYGTIKTYNKQNAGSVFLEETLGDVIRNYNNSNYAVWEAQNNTTTNANFTCISPEPMLSSIKVYYTIVGDKGINTPVQEDTEVQEEETESVRQIDYSKVGALTLAWYTIPEINDDIVIEKEVLNSNWCIYFNYDVYPNKDSSKNIIKLYDPLNGVVSSGHLESTTIDLNSGSENYYGNNSRKGLKVVFDEDITKALHFRDCACVISEYAVGDENFNKYLNYDNNIKLSDCKVNKNKFTIYITAEI